MVYRTSVEGKGPGGGGGGGTHVYWWYGDVPLWRPPFSDPDFRSLDTTHNRKSAQKTPVTKHLRSHAYQNSRVVARDCSPRSPGLKTPENSSLHCSLANLRCMHVTEVIMYNVLHYPISFSAPSLHSKIGNIVFRVVRCRSESRSFSLRTPVTHVHRVYKETLCTRRIRSLDPVFHSAR